MLSVSQRRATPTDQKPNPTFFSFYTGRLVAIMSLSIIARRYFDFCFSSFYLVFESYVPSMFVWLEVAWSPCHWAEHGDRNTLMTFPFSTSGTIYMQICTPLYIQRLRSERPIISSFFFYGKYAGKSPRLLGTLKYWENLAWKTI